MFFFFNFVIVTRGKLRFQDIVSRKQADSRSGSFLRWGDFYSQITSSFPSERGPRSPSISISLFSLLFSRFSSGTVIFPCLFHSFPFPFFYLSLSHTCKITRKPDTKTNGQQRMCSVKLRVPLRYLKLKTKKKISRVVESCRPEIIYITRRPCTALAPQLPGFFLPFIFSLLYRLLLLLLLLLKKNHGKITCSDIHLVGKNTCLRYLFLNFLDIFEKNFVFRVPYTHTHTYLSLFWSAGKFISSPPSEILI